MPFIKFNTEIEENSHTTDPDNLPVFLIPGIHGNAHELIELANAINIQRNGKTPIYIFHEDTSSDKTHQMSLTEIAQLAAAEIIEKRQNSPLPYILIGYSFGGILAAEICRQLLRSQHDPYLYVIDQPSESLTKKYYQESSEDFLRDLINIMNHAAKLSGLNPINIDTTLELISLYEPSEYPRCVTCVTNTVLGHNEINATPDKISTFVTYSKIIERNLRIIAEHEPDPLEKLNNAHVIFTKETASKHGLSNQTHDLYTGGWDESATMVTLLKNEGSSDGLWEQPHTELPSRNTAGAISTHITSNLKNKISEQDLKAVHVRSVLGPQVDTSALGITLKRRNSILFFREYNNGSTAALEQPLKSPNANEAAIASAKHSHI